MADVGEIVRVTALYTVPGSSTPQNVFHFLLDTALADSALLADCRAYVRDAWAELWKGAAADTASCDTVKVDIMNGNGTVARNIGNSIVDVDGTVAVSPQAAGVALGIFADTAFPKARGRKFIPGVSEQAIDGGLITVTIQTLLAALFLVYTDVYTGPNGADLIPGILSTVALDFIPFSGSGGWDDIPDYQRRRRPDRGS